MIIDRADVRCVAESRAMLGEGPVWVPEEGALYWVDIKEPRIFRWIEATEAVDCWVPPFSVGSLVPASGGGFVAGTAQGFVHIDLSVETYRPIICPADHLPGNRFNDGKLDREGRFWAGTMDDAETAATGVLYRLGADLDPVRVDGDYRVTNGPAFDRAGRRMYHTDSARQTIFAFTIDVSGDASEKRVFASFTPEEGYPDGMTVDAEDCLWVAFWDGWCLRRFDAGGRQIGEHAMPVARPTSCTFGGAALDTLFVTSARVGLTAEVLQDQPLAGALFAVTPPVGGVADVPFQGLTIA